MSGAKFTPGPWVVAGTDLDGWRVDHPDGNQTVVCKVRGRVTGPPGEEKENARLIASAPDLLAACKDAAVSMDLIAEQCDRWAHEAAKGGWSTQHYDAQRLKAVLLREQAAHIRNILAKAEGGT